MKLHAESEALLSEPGSNLPGDKIDRPSCSVVIHDKFDARKLSRQFSKQYAHSYAVRLRIVRPTLEEAIKSEWPGVDVKKIAELCEFSQANSIAQTSSAQNKPGAGDNVKSTKSRNSDDHGQHIAFKEDVTVAIIGTIFKYQPEKPSILQELAEDNPMVPTVPKTRYISEQDTIQLEDETTRVHLVPTPGCGLTIGDVVNGIVCAVKGKPTINGKFEIIEVVFPTPKPTLLLEVKMNTEMVFVSGLELGCGTNSLKIDILFDYLQGLAGSPSELENSIKNRTKVFFVGNTFALTSTEGEKHQTKNNEIAKKLDMMMDQISQTMDVFILPGENDPSEPMLPQVPFHRCVFPTSSCRPTFKTLSNPARIELPISEKKKSDVLDIILTSGQNVKDAIRNSETTNALEMARKLLSWGHLCPTAPDTLPLHPGVEDDVFVLSNLPNIFAVGNQPSFDSLEWKHTKIFTIPKFAETGTVVLLNNEMETFPIQFNIF